MSPEELKVIGLIQYPYPKQHLWGDWEDLEYNTKTKELFWHDCGNGDLTLICKIKDIEHLKQTIYDNFPFHRNELNLD